MSCKKRSFEKDDYPAESMYAKALPAKTHSCCGGPSSVDDKRRHDLDRLPVTYVWMTAQKTAGSQKKKKKENYTSLSTRKLSFAHDRILDFFHPDDLLQTSPSFNKVRGQAVDKLSETRSLVENRPRDKLRVFVGVAGNHCWLATVSGTQYCLMFFFPIFCFTLFGDQNRSSLQHQ